MNAEASQAGASPMPEAAPAQPPTLGFPVGRNFWAYVVFQPFLMAMLYTCISLFDDPMLPWPFYAVGNVVAFYALLGTLGTLLWLLLYHRFVKSPFALVAKWPPAVTARWPTAPAYLMLWLLGALCTLVPCLLLLLLALLGGEALPWEAACWLALCALIASLVGVILFRAAMRFRLRFLLPVSGLILVMTSTLAVTGSVYWSAHILNTPNHGRAWRAFRKHVKTAPGAKVDNIYYWMSRGYFLASGDPVVHSFRFDASEDTVRGIIKEMGLKKNEKAFPRMRIARAPAWCNEGLPEEDSGQVGQQEETFEGKYMTLTVDWSKGRVFFKRAENVRYSTLPRDRDR